MKRRLSFLDTFPGLAIECCEFLDLYFITPVMMGYPINVRTHASGWN